MQLGVSFAYVERWSDDLEQLWFLGMQILNSLINPVSDWRLGYSTILGFKGPFHIISSLTNFEIFLALFLEVPVVPGQFIA